MTTACNHKGTKYEDVLDAFAKTEKVYHPHFGYEGLRYPFLSFANVIAAVLEAAHPGILDGVSYEDKLSDVFSAAHPDCRLLQGHRTLLRYTEEERAYSANSEIQDCGGAFCFGDGGRKARRAAELGGKRYCSPNTDLLLTGGDGGKAVGPVPALEGKLAPWFGGAEEFEGELGWFIYGPVGARPPPQNGRIEGPERRTAAGRRQTCVEKAF
jgi:hypothetical protein